MMYQTSRGWYDHVTADAGRARPSWDRSASTRRTGGPFSSHDPADGSIQWPGSRCRRYAGEGDRSARKQRHRTAWRIFFEHRAGAWRATARSGPRSEEHTSELQSLMSISYDDF